MVSSVLFSLWSSHNWERKHWAWDTKEAQDIKLLDWSPLDTIYSTGILTSRVHVFATVAHRLLCPWDFPSENTKVGCHALLQRTFMTQGSNPHLLFSQWVSSLPLEPLESPVWCILYSKISAGVGKNNADTPVDQGILLCIFFSFLRWENAIWGHHWQSLLNCFV